MLWILALSGIVLDLYFRFSGFGNQSINIAFPFTPFAS